jgi:hypothetical protein
MTQKLVQVVLQIAEIVLASSPILADHSAAAFFRIYPV